MLTPTTVPGGKTSEWRGLSWAEMLAFLLLVFPFAMALMVLIRTSINIPFQDDFQAIANFMDVYAQQSGALHKAAWILTSQHNEYKLILLHAVVAIQYELTGHTNYRVIQWLGDLAVPATIVLLWLLLARQHRPPKQAIWLFIFPSYLFLSLCYWETLNFAMSELATLAVIPIAIACILAYTSPRPRMELLGAALLALAIATLASGFFLPVALLAVLLYQRRYRTALGVCLVTGAMAILYRVHYTADRVHPPNPAPHSTLLMYPVVFLGDVSPNVSHCALLGGILIVVFIALVFAEWPRRSPVTFTLALFCIVTALGVSAGRYRLGLISATAPRYAMYTLLLICAEYMAMLDMFAPRVLRQRSVIGGTLALATLLVGPWMFRKQIWTYHLLQNRHNLLATHLILWQRHPDQIVLTPDEPGYMEDLSWTAWRIRAQSILQREISEGRYIPPVTASDPLPLRPHSRSTQGIEDEQPPIANRNAP